MIFLIPLPVLGGSAIAYVVGKHAFLECYQLGSNCLSNNKDVRSTTIGAIVAVGVFFAAYSGSVRQLRHIPVMKSTAEGGTWTYLPSQSPRNIKTFKEFMSAAAPSVLLHSQGLAVATVFSGLAGGAVDGHLAEQGQQERDSRDKNSR